MKLAIKELVYRPIQSLFIVLGFSIAIFMILISASFFQGEQVKNSLNNKFYKNHVYVELVSAEKKTYKDYIEANIESGYQFTIGDFIISPEYNRRAFLKGTNESESEFKKTYNLISGRYFTEEELNDDDKLVIIGKLYKDLVYMENDKDYIDIDDITYEVIGYIGDEFSSNYNMTWIVPAFSMPKEILEDTYNINIFYIKNNFNGNNCRETLEKSMGEQLQMTIDKGKMWNSYVKTYADNNGQLSSMIFDIILSSISVVAFIIFFMKDTMHNYKVKLLVGAKKIDIIKDLFYKMLIFSVIAFTVAVTVFEFVQKILVDLFYMEMRLFFDSIILAIVIFLILLISILYINLQSIFKVKVRG